MKFFSGLNATLVTTWTAPLFHAAELILSTTQLLGGPPMLQFVDVSQIF